MTISRVLIAMAYLAHGDNLSPSGSKKTLEECITEPIPGVFMIWYNVGENTYVQQINFNL